MGKACSACGFRSENPAFFRREKTASFGRSGWFCIGCKPLPKTKMGFAALGLCALLVPIGWLGIQLNQGLEPFGYIMAMIGGFAALGPVVIVIHELGHTLAAVAVGRRVYQFNIGTGA